MHDTHLCQKMLNLLIASTELKDMNTKHVIMQKHANITLMKKNITAESPDPVIQIKSMYAYIINILVHRMVVT